MAVTPAPKDHKAAKRAALERDSHRCVVTGLIDRKSMFMFPGAIAATHTNFCHIVPPLLNWELDSGRLGPKAGFSRGVWTILESFGIDYLAELDGPKVHRLSNGLTMSIELHMFFDELELWFEEIENCPNTYNVRCLVPQVGSYTFPRIVELTSAEPDLDLPDPKYLKLHATVCQVAHMSGAAEYLEHLDREAEQLGVLANNGSSGEILCSRLERLLLVA